MIDESSTLEFDKRLVVGKNGEVVEQILIEGSISWVSPLLGRSTTEIYRFEISSTCMEVPSNVPLGRCVQSNETILHTLVQCLDIADLWNSC